MNANHEPGYIIDTYCHTVGQVSERGNALFDRYADVDAFLAWIYSDRTRAAMWADLRVTLGAATDADVIEIGMSDPDHGWVSTTR